jgi:pimeloyl-ACP methyl ester carboxylesterase
MVTREDPQAAGAEQRLKEFGIRLPSPPQPFGISVEAVQAGSLLFLSGMLPTEGREAKFIGRVGAELDAEAGYKAARLAALNALAVAGYPWPPREMSAISRKSPTAPPSCSRMCSEGTRTLADWWLASRAFRSAPRLNWNSFSRWWMKDEPAGVSNGWPRSQGKERPVQHPTYYRTTQVDGLSIFYREAGPKDAPTLLLLHGLPSSSRMFEPLFARLSDRYHLVAPDYPGFGHSDWPDPKKFAYTFDHCADIVTHFTEALGLSRYTLYMQDYGGPVGFRMAFAHPERIEALIVQNAVAHNEGLGVLWKPRRAFWADRAANESTLRANLLSLQATRIRHLGSDPDVERYDPDLWTDEFAFLSQPVQADIQADMFYDYRTNVEAYPKWQAWMRERQPRLLVIWGKYDPSFDISEPEAYRRDVRDAQVHILDAGHFALDTAADEIAALIQGFVGA